MAKKKAKKQKTTRQKRNSTLQLFGICTVLTAVIFMPTTILLFFGMAPTLVAGLIDRSGKGTKAITVGAMNLAGVTPFLLTLWSTGHTPDHALSIIFNPKSIIVCYSAAGLGYVIDWIMAGLVKNYILRKTNMRVQAISKRQGELVERWGKEVTGEIVLDASGFPATEGEMDGAAEPA